MPSDRFGALPVVLTAAPSRRVALRLLGGLGLAGLVAQTEAKKKPRKKCARAGQPTSKKRKRCCAGLGKDATGRCASPASGCTPSTCPPSACGSVPDGCGGTLNCGCAANHVCLGSGVCQPCTVICTGPPAGCGTVLQVALDAGGTVYVCPGRYRGGFSITRAVTVIGAGEGNDAASNTILDGEGASQVLHIANGEGLVELKRLRITGVTPGAGVVGINHAGRELRMTECTVSDNSSLDSLGGIEVAPSRTLVMTRCTVRDNHATGLDGIGGGITTGGTTTLTDCLVEDNSAAFGGGLYIAGGTTTLAGSTQVRGNHADASRSSLGGGIYLDLSTLVIAESCRVTVNTAPPDRGGGIHNASGTVTLQGADPSPIVVNNCHENCTGDVAKCSTDPPVSCPP